MAAGSGGIRWNDGTNMIQLMDTNKNWVDWRYFNPISEFELVTFSSTGQLNYEFNKHGLYLLVGGGDSARLTYSTGANVNAIFNNVTNSTRYLSALAITANEGQRFEGTWTVSNRNHYEIYYFGTRYSRLSLVQYTWDGGNSSTKTLGFVDGYNRVLVGVGAGNASGAYLTLTTTCQHSVTDGRDYGCAAAIEEYGSASITVRGTTASSGGGFQAIIDLQLLE